MAGSPVALHFFVVRLRAEGGKRKAEVYLRRRGDGEDVTANEAVLTNFCFPLGPDSVPPKEYMASEEYTFTMTLGDGKRLQGFCRKFLPPPPRVGSKLRYPQVMCLVTEYPWCMFYFKVLQVLEQLARSGDNLLDSDAKDLPPTSKTSAFLGELVTQLARDPQPGQVVKVKLSNASSLLGVSPPRVIGGSGDPLSWSDDELELQVPPDCGNGRWNCGISLARLLWHVPVSAMLTLLASMLLERRIVFVSQARDTVTSVVQAAAALLYPFKWHHIFLPMLPKSLTDYLTAPMPFMVGLPAQMLPLLKGIPMDEVTLIDLDLGKCDPAPGTARDDARLLPWREQLEAALTAVHRIIRSPTEYETSPVIAGIMQEFFLKLFGGYRRYIHVESPAISRQYAALVATQGALSGHSSAAGSPRDLRSQSGGAGSSGAGRRETAEAVARAAAAGDECLKGSGQVFEHLAFVASHRRNDKARAFLSAFRHSQMYEVFVQDRLRMAAEGTLGASQECEPFEERINQYQERRRLKAAEARSRLPSNGSRFSLAANGGGARSIMKKHRRTDSEEQALSGKLAERAGSMRRITTDPNHKLGGSLEDLALNPASFFEGGDDDIEDAVLMEEELEAAMRNAGLLSGDRSSASQMSVAPRAASMTAAAGGPRPRDSGSVGSLVSTTSAPGRHLPVYDHLNHHHGDSRGASSSGVHAGDASPGRHLQQQQQQTGRSGLSASVASDGHKVYEGSLGDMVKGAFSNVKASLSRTASPAGHDAQHSTQAGQPSSVASGLREKAGRFMDSLLSAAGPGGGPFTGSSQPYRTQVTGGDGSSRGKPPHQQQQQQQHRYLPQVSGSGLVSTGEGRAPVLIQPPAPARPLVATTSSLGQPGPTSQPATLTSQQQQTTPSPAASAPQLDLPPTPSAPAHAAVAAAAVPVASTSSQVATAHLLDDWDDWAAAAAPATNGAPVPAAAAQPVDFLSDLIISQPQQQRAPTASGGGGPPPVSLLD